MDRMARALAEAWPDVTLRRAVRIVRTEVIAASNWASQQGAEQTAEDYGIELEKEWLATPDSRVRDSHSAADGQRVGLRDPFTVGGYSAQYPGDPSLPASERVQCRCAVAHVPVEGRRASFLDRRDAEIRATYPALKAEHGAYAARLELAERHALSERQVRRVLFDGSRA